MTEISLCRNDTTWSLRDATDAVVSVMLCDVMPSPAYVTTMFIFGWSPKLPKRSSTARHLSVVPARGTTGGA